MQNFAAIGPFGAEIWRGGQIDPPPSKNLLSKSPVKIGLNGILKLNEVWPLEGAMYISLWENSRGHPDNISFIQFSMKIDGFEQKDSQGFENSYNSYEKYPLEKFFIFTIYQNYTLA